MPEDMFSPQSSKPARLQVSEASEACLTPSIAAAIVPDSRHEERRRTTFKLRTASTEAKSIRETL